MLNDHILLYTIRGKNNLFITLTLVHLRVTSRAKGYLRLHSALDGFNFDGFLVLLLYMSSRCSSNGVVESFLIIEKLLHFQTFPDEVIRDQRLTSPPAQSISETPTKAVVSHLEYPRCVPVLEKLICSLISVDDSAVKS